MNEPSTQPNIVEALRKKARLRSTFVPGAGLALFGYRKSGALVALPSLLMLASMFALALAPCPIGFWTFIISAGAALVCYIVEYALLGKLKPVTDTRGRPARGFNLVCLLGSVAIVAAVGVVTTNMGLFKVEGDGMRPAIEAGEFLLFSRFNAAAGLRRGAIVAYRPSPNTASGLDFEISVGRILAIPGDELSIDGGFYRVNGQPTKTRVASLNGLRPAIKPPDYPQGLIVPEGNYFVVGDQLDSYDSQALSWLTQRRVISTRMLMLSRRRFGAALN